MKKLILSSLLLLGLLPGLFFVSAPQPVSAACSAGADILSFPTWYKYLPEDAELTAVVGKCKPKVQRFSDGILILLAIVEIMIRIAIYIATIMFIFGAIKLITSQGNPDGIKNGRNTILNALIGLVIALISVGLVNLIGTKIQ